MHILFMCTTIYQILCTNYFVHKVATLALTVVSQLEKIQERQENNRNRLLEAFVVVVVFIIRNFWREIVQTLEKDETF